MPMKKVIKRMAWAAVSLALLVFAAGGNAALAADAQREGKTFQLVLLRHGESVQNTQKRASGWSNTPLTQNGIAGASAAGELMKKEGIALSAVYTSSLNRAIKTAWVALESMDRMWIPVKPTWRLNETYEGAFEGTTEEERIAMAGREKAENWKGGFEALPPPLPFSDPKSPANDPRYDAVPKGEFTDGESMKDTLVRIRSYWEKTLIPALKSGETIMVTGHGNILRALSRCLDDTLDEKTLKGMPMPNSTPIVYTLDADMKVISRKVLDGKGNQ